MIDVLRYIEKMKEMYEGERITAQGPRNMADGGRIGFAENAGLVNANVIRQKEAIKNLNDKWTNIKVKETAEILYPDQDINKILTDSVKRRKINKHLTDYGEGLAETKARKKGRIQRDITLNLVNKDKTVNIDAVRENLIKNKKKVTMVNNQFIFADEKLQQQFLDDMLLRYKYPKTSTKAVQAGYLTNEQIFKKYFEGTYKQKGVHDLIFRFKRKLGLDFSKLPPGERNAHQLRRQAKLLISQAGKRISGLDDFPAHHLYPIGDEFAHGTQDFTILDKKTNSQLSGSNKKLVGLAEKRSDLINDIQTGKISSKNFDIEMGKLDNQAQTIIDGHYKKFPKHDGLLNWRKATSVLDEQGKFKNITSTGTIGGDASKWAITDVNKQIKDLSKTELATFRSDIKNKAHTLLKQSGFNIDKCLSSGGRVGFANPAGLVKGSNQCIIGVINDELKLAKKSGNVAKFSKFGKLAKGAGYLFGWVDIPIELAFALPSLLAGDVQGAKRATTAGLFGYGGKKLDEIDQEKNPEVYKYFKHVQDINDWMEAFNKEKIAESKLEELPEGYAEIYKKHGDKSGYIDFHLEQYNEAVAKQEDITKNYIGYATEEGEEDLKAQEIARQGAQEYLGKEVKKGWKEGMDLDLFLPPSMRVAKDVFGLETKKVAPFKPDEITNLEDLIKQKGDPFYGKWWKRGTRYAAEELGAEEKLYGDWAERQFGKKDPEDIYSELPLEYASQLAALEKKEVMKDPEYKYVYRKPWEGIGYASGGLANLTRTVAPDSGPMDQGLASTPEYGTYNKEYKWQK